MTTSQPKYISSEEVEKLLTWPLVNEAVEEALKATGQTEIDPANLQHSYAIQPARAIVPSGERTKLLMCMPGFVGNYQLNATAKEKQNTLACKLVTSFAGNQSLKPPLPNILANILLFNSETGQLQCIMDGTQITAWRTAAASIVATKYLYFKRFPEETNKAIRLAVIGCGVQGESHALGMCKTFNVIDVYLYNRTKSKADKLADKLKSLYPSRIHVCDTPEKAVQEADVICVGTYSPTALINYAMLKGNDVHINSKFVRKIKPNKFCIKIPKIFPYFSCWCWSGSFWRSCSRYLR